MSHKLIPTIISLLLLWPINIGASEPMEKQPEHNCGSAPLIYNHKTSKYDAITSNQLRNLNDEQIKAYIPQIEPLLNLYDVYRMQGSSILEAYEKCLRDYIKVSEDKHK